MNFLNPIYTEKRECQDCYKCVRHCPVKAIKVEGGYASVVPELCILCGHCVEVCPNSAKRVRDDLPQARQLLALKPRVLALLKTLHDHGIPPPEALKDIDVAALKI